MSVYQHRRNFSLLATQSQTASKLKATNRSLRKIQNSNMNNYSWLLVAGRQYYYKTNNLESAIQNFQQYLLHNPTHQQCLYLCAISYMNLNSPKKAIQKLQQYITTRQSSASHANVSSLHVSNNTNRKLIINSYSQLPQLNHVYLLLSIAYFKINNIPKAMDTVNQVLKIDGKYQQAYCFRAKLYVKMGEFQKACFDYRQVLRWNQDMWEAWGGLGDYYTQTNNYHQAYKCYLRAQQCIQSKKSHQQTLIDPQQKMQTDKNQQRYIQKKSQKVQQRRSHRLHEKLSEFLKKPKKLTQIVIASQNNKQKQPEADMEQLMKHKPKLQIRNVTSPSHQHTSSNINNFGHNFSVQGEKEELGRAMKEKMFFQDKVSFRDAGAMRELFANDFGQIYQEIQLKVAICLYYLGQHDKSLFILQKLKQQKSSYSSQIYYYLGANQLKLYNQPNSAIQPLPTRSQLLHKSILNFQTSIKCGNNPKIMTKSCKALIKLYIQNNQFYETSAVIQLAQKYELDIKQYQILSQACMLVIKQKYEQAIPILKRLYEVFLGGAKVQVVEVSGKQTSFRNSSNKLKKEKNKERQNNKLSSKEKQKEKCSSMRLSSQRNSKAEGVSGKKYKINQFDEISHEDEQQEERKNLIVSTGNERKMPKKPSSLTQQNQFKNLNLKNILHTPKQPDIDIKSSYPSTQPVSNQLQWMKPIILLFRAYAQYFSDNFIECLEVYEYYENFIKDYLGKEPQSDIYLSYNKVMCEGILMLDNQMIEESIQKFVLCVENYYKLLKGVAVQPILFRILALMRLALSQNPYITEQINSRLKIYLLIVQILDHYLPAINTNPLVFYYYGLALYELQKYKQASDYLEKCLKIAEQCTWKFLYVKGVIQIKNKLYKDAIRQFSAGLLVQDKPELYLGRCICYIQLFDQSQCQQQVFMQKSFEDLQKFIELEDNKQKISKWVTKILFFNKAYDQVTKSIKKVSNQALQNDDDMIKIHKCLNIYNGIFEDGGVLGQVIINAFQGRFEDTSVEINGQRHQIILSDFVSSKYKKWLHILNLYTTQRYAELIKFLQMSIFDQKSEQEAVQLRYNLAVVYYLSEQTSKADNVLAGLTKHLAQIQPRVDKFLNRDFMLDQCVDDLQVELKGVKRLSSFLPYRKIILNSKVLIASEPHKSIYVRISIPFPAFFKPDIDLGLDDTFIYEETAQTCIPKRIQAPWIKRVTGHVQFTDNIISSHNTSLFDQDVLSPATESKESCSSEQSLIKNF